MSDEPTNEPTNEPATEPATEPTEAQQGEPTGETEPRITDYERGFARANGVSGSDDEVEKWLNENTFIERASGELVLKQASKPEVKKPEPPRTHLTQISKGRSTVPAQAKKHSGVVANDGSIHYGNLVKKFESHTSIQESDRYMADLIRSRN